MLEQIKELKAKIENDFKTVKDVKTLEDFRLKYLVKKGELTALFENLKSVPNEQKKDVGRELNLLKQFVESEFKNLKEGFELAEDTMPTIDLSLPGRAKSKGTKHPVEQVLDRIIEIFTNMGFDVAEAREIEDNYHNFDALNFAPNHPARDMQDTFFIKGNDDLLFRTHTSPVQVRVMENMKPPIRTIMPGRVYRNEAISARALAEFHQVEGLYIDKNVTFAELKGTMVTFAKKMYGEDLKYRFRASYFPFTEPSAEMDITCYLCKGQGCRVCKYSGWLEIAGCGMVHPNVLKMSGIDPDVYTGYAFGFGLERTTMLNTGINDIRALYENDIRVLKQF
jgi:phenylalanyl-tRNA synthetase alpha chain